MAHEQPPPPPQFSSRRYHTSKSAKNTDNCVCLRFDCWPWRFFRSFALWGICHHRRIIWINRRSQSSLQVIRSLVASSCFTSCCCVFLKCACSQDFVAPMPPNAILSSIHTQIVARRLCGATLCLHRATFFPAYW